MIPNGPAYRPATTFCIAPGGQADVITAPGMAVTRGTPVTAIAIPYFQWDNRDGRAMRVWMPR